MWFTIFSSLVFIAIFQDLLQPYTVLLAKVLQSQCLSLSPSTKWSDSYNAIVCGVNLPEGQFKEILKLSGLLHLIVVSGSHLVFLEQLVLRLSKKSWFIMPLLVAFVLMTGFQPPAVRSFVSMLVQKFSDAHRLLWPKHIVVFISGVLTWLLVPSWISSYSFLLSWGAAFALTLVPETKKICKQIGIYLVLYPLFLPLSPLNPISIFFNLILGPVIGAILFPLSLIAFLIPKFFLVSDLMWQALNFVLLFTSSYVPKFYGPSIIEMIFLWTYLWLVQMLFHFYRIHRERSDAQ